jgi:dTDP-4-dehydrorhamnose 3,5-epimerase
VNFLDTPIPDCFKVGFETHCDSRGKFVKTWKQSSCASRANTEFVETFHTISAENVLRGMHLQLPPAEFSKLVYCAAGRVVDVVLDLRCGSPTFGSHLAIELSGECGYGLFLPPGIAHGFYVHCAPAIMVYHVTREYVPGLDSGVAWNSFGFTWPTSSPTVSARDAALPHLGSFQSPFRYRGD